MATKTVDKAAKKGAGKGKTVAKKAPSGKEPAPRRAAAPSRAPAKPAPKASATKSKSAPAPKPVAAKPAPAKSPAKADAAKAAARAKPQKAPPVAKTKDEKRPAQKPSPKAPAKSAASVGKASGKPNDAVKSKSAKTEKPAAPDKTAAAAKTAPAGKAAPDAKAKAAATAKKPEASQHAASTDKKSANEPATKKSGKAQSAAKTTPHSPAMKKPLVGQKPRTERPASATDGIPLSFIPKAPDPVTQPPVKSSPASQEAKLDFKVDDHVVYPAHGVGRIVGIERQVIAGIVNELFLIDFEQEKMKLRVPTAKAKAVGMRQLSEPSLVKKAIETLKGRARIKRTMWSRRAQEYEAKINSGDILAVAEVVRDLFRASDQPEQSYSERQLFEAALDRLAREVAAVHKTDLAGAIAELEGALQQKKAA